MKILRFLSDLFLMVLLIGGLTLSTDMNEMFIYGLGLLSCLIFLFITKRKSILNAFLKGLFIYWIFIIELIVLMLILAFLAGIQRETFAKVQTMIWNAPYLTTVYWLQVFLSSIMIYNSYSFTKYNQLQKQKEIDSDLIEKRKGLIDELSEEEDDLLMLQEAMAHYQENKK